MLTFFFRLFLTTSAATYCGVAKLRKTYRRKLLKNYLQLKQTNIENLNTQQFYFFTLQFICFSFRFSLLFSCFVKAILYNSSFYAIFSTQSSPSFSFLKKSKCLCYFLSKHLNCVTLTKQFVSRCNFS